jgi:hypothetical protein
MTAALLVALGLTLSTLAVASYFSGALLGSRGQSSRTDALATAESGMNRVMSTFNQPVKNLEKAKMTVGGAAVAFKIAKTVDVEQERALKAGRRPEGRTSWGQPTRYELTLDPNMTPGQEVLLGLDGVVGAEGLLGVVDVTNLRFRVRRPMAILGVELCGEYGGDCPSGPLVLRTTNEVDFETLQGRVHIVRKSDGKEAVFDAEESWQRGYADEGVYRVTLAAPLLPGSTYDVKVDAGVKDDKGSPAAAWKGRAVKTGDIEPWLSISSPFVLLEKNGDGALPVENANLKAIQASVTPLEVKDLARLLADFDRAGGPGTPVTSTLVPALAIGLNWKGATRAGAIASIATGLVITLGLESLAYFKLFTFPAGVTATAIALVLSMLVFVVVSWCTRHTAAATLAPDVCAVMDA